MVFHVAQLSFFLSTFKYLVAVLMISDSGMRATDRKFLGGLLVSLDILFMLGSFCAMAVIVYLLRRSLLRIRAAEQTKKTLIQPEQNPEQKRSNSIDDSQEHNIAIETLFHRLDENSNGTLEKSEVMGAAMNDPELAKYVSPGRALMLKKRIFEPMDLNAFKLFCNPSNSLRTESYNGSSFQTASPIDPEIKLQQLMAKEKQQEQEMTNLMNKSMTDQHDRLAQRIQRKKSQHSIKQMEEKTKQKATKDEGEKLELANKEKAVTAAAATAAAAAAAAAAIAAKDAEGVTNTKLEEELKLEEEKQELPTASPASLGNAEGVTNTVISVK